MVRRVGPGVPHDPVGDGSTREFAKEQLLLFLREWYMHPNGQIPAYEFAFGDVNPPVHAWACWRVYKMTGRAGKRDRPFLRAGVSEAADQFHVVGEPQGPGRASICSRADSWGWTTSACSIARSRCPTGGHLEQADGTAWMAFYCATMLSMALELARDDPAYEDIASKFFEHFVAIADAMNTLGGTGLWDEEDGFYYDQLHVGRPIDSAADPLDGRASFRCSRWRCSEDDVIDRLPGFRKRMEWFLEASAGSGAAHLVHATSSVNDGHDEHRHRLLAIPSRERLKRVLRYLLDENEFLSPYGIRSLSQVSPRTIRTCSRVRRSGVPRRLRAGRIDDRHCSAATRTGAGRSGFR